MEHLSTTEVGKLVGVSRQYVLRLVKEGRLDFWRCGWNIRIPLAAAQALKKAREGRRSGSGTHHASDDR
jgi:excisionase family DNA binding protein